MGVERWGREDEVMALQQIDSEEASWCVWEGQQSLVSLVARALGVA